MRYTAFAADVVDDLRAWLRSHWSPVCDLLVQSVIMRNTAVIVYVEVESAAWTGSCVCRVITDAGWIRRAGKLAERERCALGLAAQTGIRVPLCLGTGRLPRSGWPVVVMTRAEGETLASRLGRDGSCLDSIADTLLTLHRKTDRRRVGDEAQYIPPYQPHRKEAPPGWLPWWITDGDPLWGLAQRLFTTTPPPGTTLIHRDFNPGNILIGPDGDVTILDWTDASWGCGFADVGHLRVNLVAMHSLQAADDFLAFYLSRARIRSGYPRIWDVYAALGMPLELGRLPAVRVADIKTLLSIAVADTDPRLA
jgi:aminoglycoside phosphotransferase (APT) family kinase protein